MVASLCVASPVSTCMEITLTSVDVDDPSMHPESYLLNMPTNVFGVEQVVGGTKIFKTRSLKWLHCRAFQRSSEDQFTICTWIPLLAMPHVTDTMPYLKIGISGACLERIRNMEMSVPTV